MTAYFDAKHAELRELEPCLLVERPTNADFKAIEDLEVGVVTDCSIASEMPGFPEDLRDQINRLILEKSINGQPVNHQGPNPEDGEEYVRLVHRLIFDLHTIFHDVVQRGIPRFSDDPRFPLRCLYADSEARRELLAAAEVEP